MDMLTLTKDDAAQAIAKYNDRFGEMERVLGCLALHARKALLERQHNETIGQLIWTLKSWWGVQGVRTATRDAMSQALKEMDWPEELFEVTNGLPDDAESIAVEKLGSLVRLALDFGAERREVSLASKVLHWLLPYHVPVFDSFVCKQLGVVAGTDPLVSYNRLAQAKISTASQIASWGDDWLGRVGPLSPLRALDKCLWWQGGGDGGKAMIVRYPWKVIDKMGLSRITY